MTIICHECGDRYEPLYSASDVGICGECLAANYAPPDEYHNYPDEDDEQLR